MTRVTLTCTSVKGRRISTQTTTHDGVGGEVVPQYILSCTSYDEKVSTSQELRLLRIPKPIPEHLDPPFLHGFQG